MINRCFITLRLLNGLIGLLSPNFDKFVTYFLSNIADVENDLTLPFVELLADFDSRICVLKAVLGLYFYTCYEALFLLLIILFLGSSPILKFENFCLTCELVAFRLFNDVIDREVDLSAIYLFKCRCIVIPRLLERLLIDPSERCVLELSQNSSLSGAVVKLYPEAFACANI